MRLHRCLCRCHHRHRPSTQANMLLPKTKGANMVCVVVETLQFVLPSTSYCCILPCLSHIARCDPYTPTHTHWYPHTSPSSPSSPSPSYLAGVWPSCYGLWFCLLHHLLDVQLHYVVFQPSYCAGCMGIGGGVGGRVFRNCGC